jgi:ABC-type amino acid transport substrate-binding protein
MKNHKQLSFKTRSLSVLVPIFATLCLWNPLSTQATAPRLTSELFGEAKVADIVSYQLSPINAITKAESDLALELTKEAFKAAGKSPVLDLLPSKQLATYALMNNDVVGLIASSRDLSTKQKSQVKVLPFLLMNNTVNDEAIALVLSTNTKGNELAQAFNDGLKKIIKNGQYLEILEKYRGKGKVPADYFTRLKKLQN